MSGEAATEGFGVAGIHFNRYVHGGFAGVDNFCRNFDQIAHVNGRYKPNTTRVGRDTIAAAPACSAGIGGEIDPFHHCAAVHFSTKIHILWLGQKTQGDISLWMGHGVSRW